MNDTFLQRTSITVNDIEHSKEFYLNVFMFKMIYHNTIPIKKISGYPIQTENMNGNLKLVMLSQGVEKPMLGLMQLTPVNEKKSAAFLYSFNLHEANPAVHAA